MHLTASLSLILTGMKTYHCYVETTDHRSSISRCKHSQREIDTCGRRTRIEEDLLTLAIEKRI